MVALFLLVFVVAVALVHFVVRLNSAHRDREFFEALADFQKRKASLGNTENAADGQRRSA